MPTPAVLPEPIAALATRQAREITEQRWQYDTDLLVKEIERFVAPERTSATEEVTPVRALVSCVVSWPIDFAQLLVRPREWLTAAQAHTNVLMRATVFFAISHIVAAWLFMKPELVASVPMFVFEGVPSGAFILLVVWIPLHFAARLLSVPSYPQSTMVVLAYIQSVAMVMIAGGIALIWTGFDLADPEFGSKLQTVLATKMPLGIRMTRASEVIDSAMGGPFLAAFVLTNVIWLYAAGWIVVASQAFRDRWRISRLRFAATITLTAVVLAVASALVAFAATL